MGQIVSVTLMVEKRGTEVPMPWNEDCSFSFSSSFCTQFPLNPLSVSLSSYPCFLPDYPWHLHPKVPCGCGPQGGTCGQLIVEHGK